MPKILLLRSYPNLLFMGLVLSHLYSIKRSVRREHDPLIWNLDTSVYHISRYANCNPHPHPHLMDGPNGVPFLCTSRGCTFSHVSGSKYMSRGYGLQIRGGYFESDVDHYSKESRDMYYQTVLEANPANPLLFNNYAKFLHEVTSFDLWLR